MVEKLFFLFFPLEINNVFIRLTFAYQTCIYELFVFREKFLLFLRRSFFFFNLYILYFVPIIRTTVFNTPWNTCVSGGIIFLTITFFRGCSEKYRTNKQMKVIIWKKKVIVIFFYVKFQAMCSFNLSRANAMLETSVNKSYYGLFAGWHSFPFFAYSTVLKCPCILLKKKNPFLVFLTRIKVIYIYNSIQVTILGDNRHLF